MPGFCFYVTGHLISWHRLLSRTPVRQEIRRQKGGNMLFADFRCHCTIARCRMGRHYSARNDEGEREPGQ